LSHALVKNLITQKILIELKKHPLFPGVFGIFGYVNIVFLDQPLEGNKKRTESMLSFKFYYLY